MSKHVLLTIVNEHICTCSVNKVVILFLQFITVINMSLLLLLLLLVLLLLFSDLYSIPNILRVVQSRRMKSAGHVACMVKGRVVHRVVVGKPEGKNHWGDPDVDGRIILRWIFRKWGGGLWGLDGVGSSLFAASKFEPPPLPTITKVLNWLVPYSTVAAICTK